MTCAFLSSLTSGWVKYPYLYLRKDVAYNPWVPKENSSSLLNAISDRFKRLANGNTLSASSLRYCLFSPTLNLSNRIRTWSMLVGSSTFTPISTGLPLPHSSEKKSIILTPLGVLSRFSSSVSVSPIGVISTSAFVPSIGSTITGCISSTSSAFSSSARNDALTSLSTTFPRLISFL